MPDLLGVRPHSPDIAGLRGGVFDAILTRGPYAKRPGSVKPGFAYVMVGAGGLEPPTPTVSRVGLGFETPKLGFSIIQK